MTENPDFVTVLPSLKPGRKVVALMRYDAREDEYVNVASRDEPEESARAIAVLWAAEKGVQVR